MSGFEQLFGLRDRVAVVTGGAAGIGKATARALAAAGATVVVADRDLQGAQAVARDLGNRSMALQFEQGEEASVVDLFARVRRTVSTADILINNAAIYPRYPFESVTAAQWDEMQRINVWGCFVALREASKLMRAAGRGGRIVNVSSIGGQRTAVLDHVTYNASKAALDSVTLSAALELAPHGILVNSVLPGAVGSLDPKPPGGHGVKPPVGPLLAPERMLLKRYAAPDEIAGPILMLVGSAGGYITGQTLVIDGGFSVS
ncbi:MAG TPA: SDR family oxidoreductase [Ramlibacter sp.]|nr:SDR family oxidoreductase [Ramlibacter sp.]